MPEKSKEPFLQRQLRKIIINEKDFKKLVKIKRDVFNKVKSWSSLKLIFLKYVADIYTNIMKNNKYFGDRYYYIDLFSGSGIGKVVDNKEDKIFGSPLLVATQHKFIKMFFCDDKISYYNALNERLLSLNFSKENFSIYNADCNSAIDDIIPKVKNGHSLIFIDPYGMEIAWKTMEKVLKLNADIIMNFQTPSIARGIAQRGKITSAARNFFKNKKEVEKIYKTALYRGTMGERLLYLYMKDIQDSRFKIDSNRRKTIIEKIRVKKDEKFYYDLIFIVRETRGGNPWLKTIKNAGNEIENLDSKIVQQVLDVLKGRQSTLATFKKLIRMK